MAQALGWARDHGVSVDDTPSYLREFEHITLARILLAGAAIDGDASSLDKVTRLLQRLLSAAEAGGRTGSVIEILVVQALAHHAGGDIPGASAPLERALTMAEPEGYVRVFVGEGASMASLLTAVIGQRAGWEYPRRLLGACTEDGETTLVTTPVERATRLPVELVEPLSERELDVLRLLATDLDGPDIARRLFVSVNTMRTHTKSIYAKLGVNSRRAAVRRAEERGILSPTRDR
jgi:LuxR family maltose regulon positive regulatory protein